jgi:hypothetical protein
LQWKIVIRIIQQCKIRLSISTNYVDEGECEVAPLDSCGVMSGIPYLWDRDATFYRRKNKYHLFKGGKAYLIKSHQERKRINPLAMKQGKTSMKQATFISNEMVDMQRKMEAFCIRLLNGLDFGD